MSVAGLVEESSAEVTVDAGSLYEAAVRGLAALRQGPFSAEDAESAAVVTVTIRPAPLVHRVKVANLVAWLQGAGKSPADRLRRQRLKAVLDAASRRDFS